ncbi:MAG: aldehyde ferredoxin oxidoreductase family protein [Planctomycetota bacterium]|nr:aldehyde ferredoxin oxidoreductase family protein [Planctomycetota bacterium]
MPPGGYHGSALHVRLDDGSSRREPLDDATLRAFLGGSGLGTKLLLDAQAAGVDPLAPEAAVVVALSPLVGSPLTTSAKFAVVAKSPLTNRISDALASDRFAIELKHAGLDALVITGAAPAWSVLVIEDGDVRLEDASDLLGLSSWDAEQRMRERLGARFRWFGIGPAGERLVRYATISGDNRHAGRGGLGAVFGSKRLKGIAVRGSTPCAVADREAVLALAKDLSSRSLGEGTAKYRELGTIANVLVLNRLGALPTRNFQAGSFEGAEAVSGEAFHAMPTKVRKHCAACTIGCEHVFSTKEGKPVRLEYEGVFALGPLCGIDDRETVLEAAARCDELGIDVISAGGTAAFAMECGERGMLQSVPAFGDGAGLLTLLDDVANRRGVGDLLAEGSRLAAERIGGDAASFACHVKGLELPGYEPRALQAMALGLAVGTRGADHNRSGAYEEDFRPGSDRLAADDSKGPAAAHTENRAALLDSLILCKFLRGVFADLETEAAAMLAAVTGWELTKEELLTTAERIVTLKKLFNEREGWQREEDTLPPRFLTEPLQGHPTEPSPAHGVSLSTHDLDRMILGYYRARGWSDDGRVPAERAAALGLEAYR